MPKLHLHAKRVAVVVALLGTLEPSWRVPEWYRSGNRHRASNCARDVQFRQERSDHGVPDYQCAVADGVPLLRPSDTHAD